MEQNKLAEQLDQLAAKLQNAKGLDQEERAALLSHIDSLKNSPGSNQVVDSETQSTIKEISAEVKAIKNVIYIALGGLVIWLLFKILIGFYL